MSIGIYGKDEDFFTLKGLIEAICATLGGHTQYERSSEPYLHPGRQALVKANNKECAVFGQLHPTVAETYGIDCPVFVAEIKLDVLLEINKRNTVYKPLPKFPAVERDFAVLVDKETPVGTLEKAISGGAGRLLERIELFDVYEGAQIPAGKKSVAFSVYLRSADSTLTDKEIDDVNTKIIKKLESVGAELRK
jgi:phenylalanyl-tRNA synthetase beta chain